MKLLSQTRSFNGWLQRYEHQSNTLDCTMVFAAYLPPQAEHKKVPALYWLSGLTCTDENFMQKSGAQQLAAELGIAIICPDTSPRGSDFPQEHDSYDFGSGAGFYLNATQTPWDQHYHMYDYVVDELPELIEAELPISEKRSISGHSMGGHGALTIALKNPGRYQSVSAFSPICNPIDCPWGEKAFSAYLGTDKNQWQQYDASLLVATANERLPILVDQGTADDFLTEQLKPETLVTACEQANHPLELRMQEDYDHSYFFIASFINDHLRHHATALGA